MWSLKLNSAVTVFGLMVAGLYPFGDGKPKTAIIRVSTFGWDFGVAVPNRDGQTLFIFMGLQDVNGLWEHFKTRRIFPNSDRGANNSLDGEVHFRFSTRFFFSLIIRFAINFFFFYESKNFIVRFVDRNSVSVIFRFPKRF